MDPITIQRVGVLGAGQMGRGIAEVAAQAGFDVTLSDVTLDLASAGKRGIGEGLGKLVQKGKISGETCNETLARIALAAGVTSLANADIVIEAVAESFELKAEMFRALDAAVSQATILASNTSSISIARLGGQTSRPDRVVGMHFMNPVPRMELVEVVRGILTSDGTHARVLELARRLGKTVVTSRDAPGFIVNRILLPLLNEACFALQEGVGTAEDIDTGARLGLSHPMGPLELCDLIGLDTVLAIASVLQQETGDPKYRAPTILRNLVSAGHLGRKTGRGFYEYDATGRRTTASATSTGRAKCGRG